MLKECLGSLQLAKPVGCGSLHLELLEKLASVIERIDVENILKSVNESPGNN